MRYLLLLAAILASTPVCAAEFTNTIELQPGDAEPWQAPRPFSEVHVGNPNIVDAIPGKTNQQLIITMKPEGGTTNILLTDKDGKLVANVRVTSPASEYSGPERRLAPIARTGAWQVYLNEDKCWPNCFKDKALTKPTTKVQSETTPSNPPPEKGSDN